MKPDKTAIRAAIRAWHAQQVEKTRQNPIDAHGRFAKGWVWNGLQPSGDIGRRQVRALERLITKKKRKQT